MLDKVIRYGEVDRFLKGQPAGTILEVGAGPLGLGACLPYQFVGVDIWYPEPPVTTQTAIRASGLQLPFADRSFDIVLCIEVLEHIPQEMRRGFVAEMCRVARKTVMVTHPYGRMARTGDHLLSAVYRLLKPFGKDRPWWLVEHLQTPYPQPRDYLADCSDEFDISINGRENAIIHPFAVFVTHLKIISSGLKSIHLRHPRILYRIARLLDFPPYARTGVTLVRKKK